MSQALVINAVTDEVLLFSLERPCTWKHKLFPAVVKKTFSIFYCRSIVKLRSWSPRWSIRRGRLHEEDGKMDSDIKVKQWGKISVVSSPCVMSWPTTHCTALLETGTFEKSVRDLRWTIQFDEESCQYFPYFQSFTKM